MAGKIKLKKLSGIMVNNEVINTNNISKFQEKINDLREDQKIIFAGQDYKGTFNNSNPTGSREGILELELERPENQFKIEGIKINITGSHSFNGKDAEIHLSNSSSNQDKLRITEKDSGWFTTQLNLKDIPISSESSLKFGEWNDYDLPDKSYVEITFT
ncbi:MAG: hypothetical protein KTV77_02785 [Wolbachia endosymbiont of Fragariocoptes setiger]|nr:hypothetical protein [Wolbachia endosymbiont of Fragariocoptes setiger]